METFITDIEMCIIYLMTVDFQILEQQLLEVESFMMGLFRRHVSVSPLSADVNETSYCFGWKADLMQVYLVNFVWWLKDLSTMFTCSVVSLCNL